MSQYLLSFARSHLDDKTDGYLALLWCMYKANQERGRYSEHIKAYLTSAADQILKMDFQRIGARFKKVLDAKPELDWVAPSGLSPLAYLQVKNFRGFGELSAEDKGTHLRFSKIKNIFYAPNGGGKSSLCEALEYGTTGHIKEAERRKTKVKPYIARGGAKVSLSLIGRDNVPVTQSVAWSSCFIDRNRLQEFSLLGSKDTGSAESDVVATLFGLEEFQEVISRFVKPESFNLTAFLRQEQTEALAKIDVDRANLIDERQGLLANIAQINDEVCVHLDLPRDQQAVVRARFARLKKHIENKIRAAERLKLAEAPTIDSLARIERAGRVARYLLARKARIEASFLRNAAAVNYRAIYTAIQSLGHAEEGDACPACSTPLHKVTENPFEKAQRELQALGGLDRLKNSQQRNNDRIVQIAADIAAGLAGIEKNSRLGVPCPLHLDDLQTATAQFQVASDRAAVAMQVLLHFIALLADNATGVAAYLGACIERHEAVAQAGAEVIRLEDEAAALQQKVDAIRGLFAEKTTSQQLFKVAGSKIARLMEQRSILQNDDADISRFNALIRELQVEYGNLYRDLLQYKLSLEKVRIAGIETKAAEYYKAINDHDDEHEQIDSILFDKVNDSYRIRIINANGTSQDAFSVLSEGHLRALGLSLLLAMAEKNKFPLIVFDDVVNAIDSDHRSNIIDLCFSDPYLKRTQMVVTTHDRLFWERFCIIAERHPQADQHSSCVLTYTNKGIVAVDHAGGFQGKVHEALRVYDVRQALIYCRIWFESIVVEYCLENAVAVTAQFSKSQLKKNAYLQISLEKTFSLVEPFLAYDLKHFNLIKNDLVNWRGQNQEHHAFDEGSLNFVHSKTSKEVVRIYDAIRLLECQLFPRKKQETCEAFLEDVNKRIGEWVVRIGKLDKAPAHKQQEAQQRLALLRKRGAELAEELAYISVCLANTAQPSAQPKVEH
ncbi:DNA replication and repair protein RecF [compost metagenome]